MPFFRKANAPEPMQPEWTLPRTPGALLFTLRSVPRHYTPLEQAIQSKGDARIYFGEPLAYIKGKGIALFRIEATGFDWIPELLTAWAALEHQEAFKFDINLYVHDTEWIGSLQGLPADRIEAMIRNNAPTFQPSSV